MNRSSVVTDYNLLCKGKDTTKIRMINSKTLFQQLIQQIHLAQDPDEIKSILYLLFEKEFGLRRTDVLAEKEIPFIDRERIGTLLQRINSEEPIQYILEEAEFYNRRFYVNSSVLIPRPETELIIQLIKAEMVQPSSILDVGTGSGCIAITLALEFPMCHVHAIDISEKALAVARTNSELLKADVHFLYCDILTQTPDLSSLDLIVSNPPYVMEKERIQMSRNVVAFEPALALFVPDSNPLLFYYAIAQKGKKMLRPKGIALVEINEKLGEETSHLFQQVGYNTEIVTDINGKDRVLRAELR
ncbi:MAG: peptide chain release factor N(5)-glutamine methyltransferase [Flammeovirgaceae bacterium]|jgi:release factor glutamine methyltransferase|nr:peptide chain release factor N(5)-glutamine methyltransferase [Flammeovirgaceae bacterium]